MKDHLIVYVRIALYFLAGRALAGGWLPESVADQLTNPATVETVASTIMAVGMLAWYQLSKARKALRGKP